MGGIYSKLGAEMVDARAVLRSADAVCFDVDSTVIAKEGIDELAAYLGVGDKVAALTAQAMGGDVPFEVALANRLAVMKPSKRQLDQMMEAHPVESWLTPGILELIGALQAKGKRVFLVSGGFREMIEPIAKAVGISKDDIYANSLRFHADGSFAGHNPDEPTCCSGGKARVVVELKSRYSFSSVVMIGDGATDMEARELEGGADAFIGFGGVQIREKVKAGADLFITDFKEIMDSV